MANAPLATVGETQVISEKLVNPYLKDRITVGISQIGSINIRPIKEPVLTDNEYNFVFPSCPYWLDTSNAELYVKGQLVRIENGKPAALAKNENVILTNNSIHSLFESVTVTYGKNQVQISENMRPITCFIKQLMRHSTSRSLKLRTCGFSFESGVQSAFNDGLARKTWTAESKVVEFLDNSLISALSLNSYLPPNFATSIRLKRSASSIYVIIDADKVVEYAFVIDDIQFIVPTVRLNPAIEHYMDSLLDKSPARYNFESLDVRQFSVPQGTINKYFSGAFVNRIPQRLMLALYEDSNLAGTLTTTPLFTAKEAPQSVAIYMNGTAVKCLESAWEEDRYAHAYKAFLNFFEASENEFSVDYNIFKAGYKCFCFDFMQGTCASEKACSDYLLETGSLDIELRFKTKSSTNLILLAIYPSPDVLDIDINKESRITKAIL